MLKGIDPILNADVLYALRAMGHGDDLIIADTNFPSDSVARETILGEVLRIDRSAADVIRATRVVIFGNNYSMTHIIIKIRLVKVRMVPTFFMKLIM